MTVKICDFYPYEPFGIRTKVDRQKKQLQSSKVKPIEVFPVDGEQLVIDGTNRVLAARELGMTEIEATEAYRPAQEMRPYRDALAARAADQGGFQNVPIDLSMGNRRKRY